MPTKQPMRGTAAGGARRLSEAGPCCDRCSETARCGTANPRARRGRLQSGAARGWRPGCWPWVRGFRSSAGTARRGSSGRSRRCDTLETGRCAATWYVSIMGGAENLAAVVDPHEMRQYGPQPREGASRRLEGAVPVAAPEAPGGGRPCDAPGPRRSRWRARARTRRSIVPAGSASSVPVGSRGLRRRDGAPGGSPLRWSYGAGGPATA